MERHIDDSFISKERNIREGGRIAVEIETGSLEDVIRNAVIAKYGPFSPDKMGEYSLHESTQDYLNDVVRSSEHKFGDAYSEFMLWDTDATEDWEEELGLYEKFIGYHKLKSGLEFLGGKVCIDEDTSSGIYAAIYFDASAGGGLRVYFPESGNTYDTDNNCEFDWDNYESLVNGVFDVVPKKYKAFAKWLKKHPGETMDDYMATKAYGGYDEEFPLLDFLVNHGYLTEQEAYDNPSFGYELLPNPDLMVEEMETRIIVKRIPGATLKIGGVKKENVDEKRVPEEKDKVFTEKEREILNFKCKYAMVTQGITQCLKDENPDMGRFFRLLDAGEFLMREAKKTFEKYQK